MFSMHVPILLHGIVLTFFFFSFFFFFLQQTSALFQRSSGFRGPTIPGDSQHRGRALCFVRHLFHHGLLSVKERQV